MLIFLICLIILPIGYAIAKALNDSSWAYGGCLSMILYVVGFFIIIYLLSVVLGINGEVHNF